MKTILLILLVSVSFYGCSFSKESKAKKLIKANLKETLHDWDSYESVKFGKLDSVFTSIENDTGYVYSLSKLLEFKNLFDENVKDSELYSGMYSSYYVAKYSQSVSDMRSNLDSMKVYKAMADSISDNFKSTFNGFEMNHSYRAKNASGNKIIGHFVFYFDKEIKEIIKSEDIGENSN